MRLQYAEQHLAELERVLPVESQRREVAQSITSAERRAKLAEEFRSQVAEIAAQRIELESLAATVAARCDWLSAASKQSA